MHIDTQKFQMKQVKEQLDRPGRTLNTLIFKELAKFKEIYEYCS